MVVQNQKNEILLVKHTYIPGWHLPGSGVDLGEDVETAARREVFEETGISDLDNLQFTSTIRNKAVSRRDHISYFRAQTTQQFCSKTTVEIAEIKFFPCSVARDIVLPEYKKFIEVNA